MEILGLSLTLLVLFVSFGFMVGVLFGFFGMGGSFLITPTLLLLDYPASVAIGSGLAFYFGTSVIAVLKHYDVGQVDYKLGAILFVVLSIGIELGSRLVFGLEALGVANLVTGVAYVVLLGESARCSSVAPRISRTKTIQGTRTSTTTTFRRSVRRSSRTPFRR